MRTRIRNNRLRLKFIFGISLISIIPIMIVGYFSYIVSYKSLQEELGQAKIETLKQVQNRVDDKLITLNKTIIQHLHNSAIEEFIELERPIENVALYKETLSLLASVEALVDNVESATLYIPQKEVLISADRGVFPATELDYKLFTHIENNKQLYFWIDDLNREKTMRDGSKNITYVRAIPLTAEQPKGYLIIRIKDQAFIEVYNELDRSRDSEILIATPNGTIFSDWYRNLLKDDSFNYPFITTILSSTYDEHYYIERIEEEDMLISYTKSSYNDWTYISVIPSNQLSSSFIYIKRFTFWLCISIGIACLITALLLSHNFYKGIRSILDRIKERMQLATHHRSKGHEIEIINHYMDNLQDQNYYLHKQIEQDRPVLVSNFIHNLLHETMPLTKIQQQFSYFKLPNESPYYTVICIELRFGDELNGEEIQLLMYGAENICDEITEDYASIVNKIAHNQIVVIINHIEDNDQYYMNTTFQLSEEIIEQMSLHLQQPVSIGVGRCYTLDELRHSFKEAREALQYQIVMGTGKVIYIEQVEPLAKHHSYNYPYQIEQRMMLFIKLGQFAQVEELLQQFTKALRSPHNVNVEQIKISFTQLAYRAQKELFELDSELASRLLGYSIVDKINKLGTIQAIENWIREDVLRLISEQFQIKRDQTTYDTMKRVLHYIEEHYDEDLSQPILAELIELPPSQFAQLFKDQVGMTFSDYLIHFRMEKAKSMLLETDKKVSEIAEHLRYNNAQNFIRTFRKITGVTPGEYRTRTRSKSESL